MKRNIICILSVVLAISLVAGVVFSFVLFKETPENTLRRDFAVLSKASPLSIKNGENGYVTVAKNDSLALNINAENGNFYVENLNSGYRWISAPENALEDPMASNIYRMDLASLLYIKFFDFEKKTSIVKNSETSCLRKDGISLYTIDNGFRIDFEFSDYGFTIPVEISLQEDYLNVRVVTGSIIEENPEKFLLCGVSVLPNFGAQQSSENGYIFMPDGCGALMHLSNKSMQEYSQNLYNKDAALNLPNKPLNQESATLPVFGIKADKEAFLSVITAGDSSAVFHAAPVGYFSSRAIGYVEYILRTNDTYIMDETSIDAVEYTLYQNKEIELSSIEQRYYFLEKDQADYNGMAARYKKYLIDEEGLKAQEINTDLLIDFYAAVRKSESIAGFLVNNVKPLSTVDEMSNALNSLYANSRASVSVRIMSYSKNGLSGKIDTSLLPASRVGSLADLKALNQLVVSHGGILSLGADLVNFKNAANGINTSDDTVKNFSNSPVYTYDFLYGTRKKNSQKGHGYILNPLVYSSISEKIMNSKVFKNVSGFSPYNITTVYGSYGDLLVTKEDQQVAAVNFLETFKDKSAIVLDEPASYAFKYTDLISNAPTSSSGFLCMDEEIPFYQLAVSALVNTAGAPINLVDDEAALLKTITGGSIPHFALITGDKKELIGSSLSGLYSSVFSEWEDNINKAVDMRSRLNKITNGTAMISYENLSHDVAIIAYENGSSIIVNYSNDECEVLGVKVRAMNFEEKER